MGVRPIGVAAPVRRSVREFRTAHEPDECGTWRIMVQGGACAVEAARAFGRYDAVVRWAVRRHPRLLAIMPEQLPVYVPDDYGLRKRRRRH